MGKRKFCLLLSSLIFLASCQINGNGNSLDSQNYTTLTSEEGGGNLYDVMNDLFKTISGADDFALPAFPKKDPSAKEVKTSDGLIREDEWQYVDGVPTPNSEINS